jgi:hypothetical protein
MAFDPYFGEIGRPEQAPAPRHRWLRRAFLYPLLAFSGCHMLMTGSPVPLLHIERPDRPVVVSEVTDDALVLADGSRVRLPFMKRLPKGNPVFLRALRHGVEVTPDGRAIGLVDPPRSCGNDPVLFYRMRADLSEMAGLVDPDGIDGSIVHPEEIRYIRESCDRTPSRSGMPFMVMHGLARVRRVFEDSAAIGDHEAVVNPSSGPD